MPVAATGNVRTTSTNANLVQDIYMSRFFVETLRADLLSLELADMEMIPLRTGKVIRWQYFANPSAATTPLTEGTDPANSQSLGTTKIEGTIAQYGDYFEHTDFFEDVVVSGSKQAIVAAAAYAAKLTIDTLVHTELATTTQEVDSGAALTASGLNAGARSLSGSNAKPHPKSPGGQFFIFMGTPEQCYDLTNEGNPAWHQVKAEAVTENLTTPINGTPAKSAVFNVIVKQTTQITTDTGTAPDNNIGIMVSRNSFGVSSLHGGLANPQVMIVNPQPSLASPLGLRGTIGWKLDFVVKKFDSNRICRVLSDVTGT